MLLNVFRDHKSSNTNFYLFLTEIVLQIKSQIHQHETKSLTNSRKQISKFDFPMLSTS
jgi:hypothetical protein